MSDKVTVPSGTIMVQNDPLLGGGTYCFSSDDQGIYAKVVPLNANASNTSTDEVKPCIVVGHGCKSTAEDQVVLGLNVVPPPIAGGLFIGNGELVLNVKDFLDEIVILRADVRRLKNEMETLKLFTDMNCSSQRVDVVQSSLTSAGLPFRNTPGAVL